MVYQVNNIEAYCSQGDEACALVSSLFPPSSQALALPEIVPALNRGRPLPPHTLTPSPSGPAIGANRGVVQLVITQTASYSTVPCCSVEIGKQDTRWCIQSSARLGSPISPPRLRSPPAAASSRGLATRVPSRSVLLTSALVKEAQRLPCLLELSLHVGCLRLLHRLGLRRPLPVHMQRLQE